MITVFTPTYNRAYTLERLYKSLQSQTYQKFEWIVVDDGSIDNTEALIHKFMKEKNEFEIQYKKVENGGKHRAINIGVSIAKGELFYIVDSDDCLPKDSLKIISDVWNSVVEGEREHFAGICGQRGNFENKEIGSSFSGEILDITYLETKKYGIFGDKAEVYCTAILRKFPFPEFVNEKFISESVVWDRIAESGLKLRYFNEIIYWCEYLPDGLTAMGNQKIRENPKGYGLYLQQSIRLGKISKINKWNKVLEYCNELNDSISIFQMANNLGMNVIELYFRVLGLKIFYRIYR